MAIGTMTSAPAVTAPGNATPIFLDPITFDGDDSYPTGGTAAFEDAYQALKKSSREVIAVISMDCGGYIPVYDNANDKLKVYEAAADGNPLDEVTNTTDLSSVSFKLLVIAR